MFEHGCRIRMMEDKLLIVRFKCGSSKALTQIYQKYKNAMLKLAAGLLNDCDLAEDVVHDVFVSFAQSAAKLKLNGNLRSYLATCVANHARNIHKRNHLHPTDCPESLESIETRLDRPEQWILRNEQMALINKALTQLSSEQREVISLHLDGRLTFKDIAKFQNVSINTVQSRYRYGLDKLRSILNSEVKHETDR